MILPNNLKSRGHASQVWLERQLQIDEATLPDLNDRRTYRIKKTTNPFTTLASAYGFGRTVHKEIFNFLFSI